MNPTGLSYLKLSKKKKTNQISEKTAENDLIKHISERMYAGNQVMYSS